MQKALNAKIADAQRNSQELNMSVDKLEGFNKSIERRVVTLSSNYQYLHGHTL
jgi:hypothetical protein